jgi:phosphoribosylformylglycinamidine (FGAM) synthase-like enzyme
VDFGNEEQKKTFYKTMLMTFCDQMLQGDYKSSNELQDKSETGLRVTLAELLVKADRDLYIVIDALDQIPQQDERLLVEELNNFVQRHKKENKHRLSVIVSSRNQISYKKFPEYNAAQINVKSSDNSGDIKAFLTKTLNSDAFDNNPALKQVVLSKLMDQANGMLVIDAPVTSQGLIE